MALLLSPLSVFSASFDYLYIEANEGNSSGGHSALQFGDEIYHYQHHDSGLIRLFRQDKQEFHFQYRFLQNRRIHLNHIDISEQTFTLLRNYFNLQFLAQEQQFKQLHTVHKNRALLRRLIYQQSADDSFLDTDFSSLLQLKGAGLFYTEQELKQSKKILAGSGINEPFNSALIIEMLRKKIEQHYGPHYLLQRREQISTAIRTLAPAHWPARTPMLSKDHFPPAIISFADNYEDYLSALVAIKVLLEQQSLNPAAYFVSSDAITPEQRQALQRFQQQLAVSLIKSVNSGRPDWGYAVLVNIARFIAIERSLQLGLWVFIDDFAIDSEWLSAEQFAQNATQMQIQTDDALANLLQGQKSVLDPDGLTESNYRKLEMAANRYVELLKGKQQQAIRYSGEKALPTKSVSLPDGLVPALTQAQLTSALIELDQYENQLLQEMASYYQYDLISRNCVTELFSGIDRALLSLHTEEADASKRVELAQQDAINHLGGTMATTYNFIPFVSFQSVQQHYNVTKTEVLNSYRGQQLDKIYAQDNGLSAVLRESNIFTSTVYDYHSDDAFFVFFTDDTMLFRPVFGLFNTAAGMGQSVLGLFSWPFDAGKNLKSGATGVLMSLPELVFFNMRKGSYQYLSYAEFKAEEQRKQPN